MNEACLSKAESSGCCIMFERHLAEEITGACFDFKFMLLKQAISVMVGYLGLPRYGGLKGCE